MDQMQFDFTPVKFVEISLLCLLIQYICPCRVNMTPAALDRNHTDSPQHWLTSTQILASIFKRYFKWILWSALILDFVSNEEVIE